MKDTNELDHLCGQRLIHMPAGGWFHIGEKENGKPGLVKLQTRGDRNICPGVECGMEILAQDLLAPNAAQMYTCMECSATYGVPCKDTGASTYLGFHECRREYAFTIKTLEMSHRSRIKELNTRANRTPKRATKGDQGVLF